MARRVDVALIKIRTISDVTSVAFPYSIGYDVTSVAEG